MTRYRVSDLIAFATELLGRSGMEPLQASTVAGILVEGDLLGHSTHGLALLAGYLGELENGTMTKSGEPLVVADFPAAVTWDGRRLPGPWLTVRALELAMTRAEQNGTATVVIRRSHHIACLAAYLKRATDRGFMAIITCSDPNTASVAPHGGKRAVFTPNPLAAAWPTKGDPVILDVSMSITTNGMTKRLENEGRKFPGVWAVDANGVPTDEPAALFTQPPGALLPFGGIDHGHKGYAFALLIEALTGGLAGHGRADEKEGWGATVMVQVFAPECFAGSAAFREETEHVAQQCRSNPPRAGIESVRLPGSSGLRRREDQITRGVELYPGITDGLEVWSAKLGVPMPGAVDGTSSAAAQ